MNHFFQAKTKKYIGENILNILENSSKNIVERLPGSTGATGTLKTRCEI